MKQPDTADPTEPVTGTADAPPRRKTIGASENAAVLNGMKTKGARNEPSVVFYRTGF